MALVASCVTGNRGGLWGLLMALVASCFMQYRTSTKLCQAVWN